MWRKGGGSDEREITRGGSRRLRGEGGVLDRELKWVVAVCSSLQFVSLFWRCLACRDGADYSGGVEKKRREVQR